MSRQLLYIMNPISGADADRRAVAGLLSERLEGIAITSYETTGRDDAGIIRQLSAERSWDGVLVGGGDGTLNMVAGLLHPSGLPIGIIPLGSANGMAACLEIEAVEDTLEAVLAGRTRPIDALDINGRLCLHLSDFGFNAGMIKKYDEGNQRGMLAYFKSTLQEVLDSRPYRFLINFEGHYQQVEAKMVVIANGHKYGTQAVISPGSLMDDGMLEIVALNPEGLDQMLSLSVAFFRGTLDELPFVRIWSVKQALIKNLDQAAFQIDGEVIDDVDQVRVVCQPGKLNFFVPPA